MYPGILPQLRALGVRVVEVEPDEQGIRPDALASILAGWSCRSLAFPKVLYLTPTGGNPTGATASEARKRDVLALVRQYDLLLLEDDAYYYLDYSNLQGDPTTRKRSASYLSMDPTAQNVLRFDSFSKVGLTELVYTWIAELTFLRSSRRECDWASALARPCFSMPLTRTRRERICSHRA